MRFRSTARLIARETATPHTTDDPHVISATQGSTRIRHRRIRPSIFWPHRKIRSKFFLPLRISLLRSVRRYAPDKDGSCSPNAVLTLVTDGKLPPTFRSSRGQHFSTIFCFHSRAKPVLVPSLARTWLECSLHVRIRRCLVLVTATGERKEDCTIQSSFHSDYVDKSVVQYTQCPNDFQASISASRSFFPCYQYSKSV
jgi:hypothetical protein